MKPEFISAISEGKEEQVSKLLKSNGGMAKLIGVNLSYIKEKIEKQKN
jgi:hypothetical protein